MGEVLSERNRAAAALFAPIAPTYDRWARLLSLGQDPRWRSFLASRIDASPADTILDVATGTAAVAVELVNRFGCRVVGIDQSDEMLAEARGRVARAGMTARIELVRGRAESLPFEAASFDGLTFTYLLRYVDDPDATLRELARVVRPGGRVAMLEFSLPPNRAARLAWEAYVRAGLPLVGRAVSPGWADVGAFLGPSIRSFWARYPLERVLALFADAGIAAPRARTLSAGGGVVVWGERDA